MTTLDWTAIYSAAHPDLLVTAPDATHHVVGRLPGVVFTGQPVEEPTTLALALIGLITLAAYHGIWKRVTGPSAPAGAVLPMKRTASPKRSSKKKSASRKGGKTRRRAA